MLALGEFKEEKVDYFNASLKDTFDCILTAVYEGNVCFYIFKEINNFDQL